MSNGAVILYNQGGREILKRVSVEKAWNMLWRGVAKVLEVDRPASANSLFDIPKSIELVRYVYAKWRYDTTGKVPFSRKGVLRRDNYICCYCGKPGANTIDHVLPKWQGNAATWNNAVAACQPCNNKKGGRTPKEAGMKMRFQPSTPSFADAYKWSHGIQ